MNEPENEPHPAQDQPPLRPCGGCQVCCYVFAIPEMLSEEFAVCKHQCDTGCDIWEQPRPLICTEFKCVWMNSNLPDRYRPDRVGLVGHRLGDKVIELAEIRPHAADEPDAKELIRVLGLAGHVIALQKCEPREAKLIASAKHYASTEAAHAQYEAAVAKPLPEWVSEHLKRYREYYRPPEGS
ncbi:MAG: hypothetical protein HQ567_30015 [Candidatus Nealsonbacteria bacterium]|nr:hypothetical protein [Candidatus Nealsonbacteria bacterium]